MSAKARRMASTMTATAHGGSAGSSVGRGGVVEIARRRFGELKPDALLHEGHVADAHAEEQVEHLHHVGER